MKVPPRKPPTSIAKPSVKAPAKKAAAKPTGYAENSGFDRVKGAALKVAARIGGSPVRREISRDFIGIKRGLRTGNDALVKSGVAELAGRLKLALPDPSKLTGWGAFGSLGEALGHKLQDPSKFNRFDYRHVMHLARAAGGKINDPDPSNGRVF